MAPLELPELLVADAAAWRDWLVAHHDAEPGVYLVLTKKGGTTTTVTYDQALDEALCVGWIDGHVKRRDEQTYSQRFTPRRAKSAWSARNVSHIARLRADGRMLPAGEAAVAAAQADGRWEVAYSGSATAVVPDDLTQAIAAYPAAQAMFDQLNKTNRYALIYRINEAKRADTRARRITQFVEMLARGETIHPQRTAPSD